MKRAALNGDGRQRAAVSQVSEYLAGGQADAPQNNGNK